MYFSIIKFNVFIECPNKRAFVPLLVFQHTVRDDRSLFSSKIHFCNTRWMLNKGRPSCFIFATTAKPSASHFIECSLFFLLIFDLILVMDIGCTKKKVPMSPKKSSKVVNMFVLLCYIQIWGFLDKWNIDNGWRNLFWDAWYRNWCSFHKTGKILK